MNERVEYPNAVLCERGYDVMGRVSEIAWSGYDGADADSRTYAYDNADNIVSIATADGETIDYVYDGIDRLAGVSVDGAAVAEYAYDVLGNLVAVANSEDSFEILVDGGHSLADVSADGTPLRVYMRGPGVDNWLGFVDMTGTTPVPYYYVTDHLGSVIAVVDANGNVVERYVSESGETAAQYVYDPYGNVIDSIGDIADVFSFGFSTKYHDRETGVVSYQRRFYRPDLGRWLNRDPIEEEGGENLYVFCKNNPICVIDTNGCGTWSFGIPSPWGNKPDFTVSYELDEYEKKICKGVKVLRYVRGFKLGKTIYGGQIGPYLLDGEPEQFVSGDTIGYAPDDWPEGPGIGWWDTPYYRTPWSWDFKFEAVCTKGCLSGKTLSTRKKLYWADGHKPGDDSFNHGFSDVHDWWPDLTLPTVFNVL